MDFRGGGGGGGGPNKKRNSNPQKSSSSSSTRYNVTPPSSSSAQSQQDQMSQLLLQQYFMQEQERGGGGGGGGNNSMAAAQAAAAAALFGGLIGDKMGGGGGGNSSSREQQQQLSELFAAAAAQQQQQQQSNNRSQSSTPSPRISSPHQSNQQRNSQQSQSSAAATAAALQQLTAASVAAALQQQQQQSSGSGGGKKSNSNNNNNNNADAAQAALAAQQQWMYLDYLQRIQQDVQAQQQAAVVKAVQQQQQQQQAQQQSKGGRGRKPANEQQQMPPLRGKPPQQNQRMSQQQQKRNSSQSDLTRLFEQYAQQAQQQPNSNSLLKSSVLASAKLPADTEIIVQKNNRGGNNSSMLQQLQQKPQNKRGPKPKIPAAQTITSEQAKFEQQLINLGNNNAITITPANLDMKSQQHQQLPVSLTNTPSNTSTAPITITPAAIQSGNANSPPPAHTTPFRYGNDKRDQVVEDPLPPVEPAYKITKELYTHVIPRKPQIGLIGPNRKGGGKKSSANNQNQSQFRHHRPWIIEPNEVIITPSSTSTPPPLNLNKDNKLNSKYNLNIPTSKPEPIIISPPDYSIPVKDGWKREMILKNFDLNEENLTLACEVTYISPEGKVFSSLNEIKKCNIPDPKNYTFNSKIQLGRFVLPVSENCTKRFDYDELVEYFNTRKHEEAVRKRNLRMRHEHNNYVKLLEAFRKNKRKLKLGVNKKLIDELGGCGGMMEKKSNELDELIDDVKTNLPRLKAIDGKKLNDKTFANLLQIHEFLHTFGETLGFDSESLPSLASLQKAFLHVEDNEEELVSVLCHLLVCAVEDPGLPNPTGAKHLTPFGQTLKQADVTFGSMSEILRIYLNGICDSEPEAEEFAGWLEVAPFTAQSAFRKSVIVVFICDLLLQNKAVLKYLENCSELIHNCKKERQQNDIRVRKLRMLVARKQVAASIEVESIGGGIVEGEAGSDKNNGMDTSELLKNGDKSNLEELVSAGEDSMMQGDDDKLTTTSATTPSSSSKDPVSAAVASVAELISSDPYSRLSIEELNSKMASIGSTNEKLKKQMQNNSKCIRSVCLGQDRWRRRYWNLHYGGGVYVEGGATGEFEEVRESVSQKFKDDPEAASMEVVDEEEEEPVAAEPQPTPTDSETATTPIKKEKDENGEDIVETNTKPTTTKTTPTAFTVPPPVIKIFSFTPRPPCSGRNVDLNDNVRKLTDDELLAKSIRGPEWFDWKCVGTEEVMTALCSKLCDKGIRERNLKNSLTNVVNGQNKFGVPELRDEELDQVNACANDDDGYVDPELLYKIHLGLIETLETLEERVASASLQVKGWVLPSRNLMAENLSEAKIIEIVKERVLDLENAVERRYLKPPLGKSGLEVNLTQLLKESEDVSYNMLLDGPIGSTSSTRGQQINENNKLKMELKEKERIEKEMAARKEKEEGGGGKGESRFLNHWREAIAKTSSPSVLSMAIYILDSSIAWDKSVMKASCQLCKGGDNEDKLLLCDACDRGYHTYCFKPPLENIPDGDWFCWECINKATGNKCCIVCGKGVLPNVKLLCCDKCVKAYHTDCIVPPVSKAPRGRWFCPDHRDGGSGGVGGDHFGRRVTLSQAISVSMMNNSSSNSGGGGNSGGEEKAAAAPTPPAAVSAPSSKRGSPSKKKRGSEKDGNVSDSSNSSSFVAVGNTTPAASSQESDGGGDGIVLKPARASTPVGKKEAKKKKSLSKKKKQKAVAEPVITSDNNDEDDDEEEGEDKEDVTESFGFSNNFDNESKSDGGSSPEKVTTVPTNSIKVNSKKFKSEMAWCERILDELVGHEDAWPFLEPVNTRQFPTYKKIIKTPMDLQTIRTRLVAHSYKNKEAFLQDVRLIFYNCETFNEDDSPVGKAGHTLRVFFESKPGVIVVPSSAAASSGGGSGGGGK